ncbi:MAG: hypothetical protein HY986_18675 [Candidatus Melainabacteria bacterium]|nr:hypothetical protein [Candidatus Melainabacteria bacterium]
MIEQVFSKVAGLGGALRAPVGESPASFLESWPIRLAALGLIIGMTYSAPLWLNLGRTLPVCPLLPLGQLEPLTPFLCITTIVSAFSLVLLRSARVAVGFLLASLFALVLLDLNRLQPWVYEYCLIILLFTIADKSPDLKEKRFQYLGMIIIAIYFFSGIEKLNWRFLTGIGPWLGGFSPSPALCMSDDQNAVAVSLLMCLGEIFMALLLVFRRTRFLGICGCMFMHLSILAMLGPQGLNINAVVWPWNIFQMLLMAGCFMQLQNSGLAFLQLDFSRNRKASSLVAFTGLLLPILGLFQLVDPYPSFSFYSGDVPRGRLIFKTATLQKLPPQLQRICRYDRVNALCFLDFADWALIETTAPAYPSKFCLLSMAKAFASTYRPDSLVLRISTFPKFTCLEKREEVLFKLNSQAVLISGQEQ